MIPKRIIERKGKPGLAVIIGVSRGTVERNVLQPMREIYGPRRIGQIVTSKNTAMIFGEEVYMDSEGVKYKKTGRLTSEDVE